MSTTIQRVVEGGKVKEEATPTALKRALEESIKLVDRGEKKAEKMKERVGEATDAVIIAAEVQGTAMVASMAEGYFGKDKMKILGVDPRAIGGFGLQAWALYDILDGNAGTHQLGVGVGLGASYVSSKGVEWGQDLRTMYEKKAGSQGAQGAQGGANSSQTPALPQGAGAVAPDAVAANGATPGAGPVRDVRPKRNARPFERFRRSA
jgi:hypothetical protein